MFLDERALKKLSKLSVSEREQSSFTLSLLDVAKHTKNDHRNVD